MPNISDFDRLYRRTATGVGVDAEIVRVYLPPVPPARMRVLTHVTAEDTTNAFDNLRIGIQNGGVRFYLDELAEVAQSELAVCRSDVILAEGDMFFAEFDSADTGDTLLLTVFGWTKDL